MASPFDPRDVEILAAALPPRAANPIGQLTRSVLVLHAKRTTPGNASSPGRKPYVATFFPNLGSSPYEAQIAPLTGLDDTFFAGLAVAMLCEQIWTVTTTLRRQMLADRITQDLTTATTRVRQNSFRFYAYLAGQADSPIRTALAAFPDEPRRVAARQHYLAGLTSAAWVNNKLVQDKDGNWQDRDWELYHHWIKLTALGASVAEIDAAITKMIAMRLPVPPALGPGAWYKEASWLGGNLGGNDVADASAPILETGCLRRTCCAEYNSYEFTSISMPGNPYRGSPSGSCFAPGTRVVMADASLRPIEEIAGGDMVQTPMGPRQVLLRGAPLRGARTLVQFSGTRFAFAPSHPFLLAPSGLASAAYAAAEPDALAHNIPTLSQFGIAPLNGPEPAILLRHMAGVDAPFPAPKINEIPGERPELLYDLFLDVGADGRSEYYAGDDDVQLLVSSEVPRFAAAPETTAVVLHVLRQAGPSVLKAMADVPDRSFEDLLCVGFDSLATTLMPTIGPQLPVGREPVAQASSRGTDDAAELAASVRDFATTMGAMPDGSRRRMGIMVERFAARFGPQFMAVLAMPWRTFDLATEDVANMLAVTPYSIELFRPGPPVGEAEIEVSLGRGRSRATRRLRARRGAPADRWYYGVDAPAYFPEWAPPGQAVTWRRTMDDAQTSQEDLLWDVEIGLWPDAGYRIVLPLPRDIRLGYQEFRAPIVGANGAVIGQTLFDVRLLTLEAYATEARARDATDGRDSLTPLADRLARLAAEFVETEFAAALAAFRNCAATIRMP